MSPKSEKEKMLAGESYNCLDPELAHVREGVKELLRLYNLSATSVERPAILQELLGGIWEGAIIEPPFYCSYGKNIYIGDHVYLNVCCTILDCSEVHIGQHVMIGPMVQLYTPAHDLKAEIRIQGYEVGRPIVIEDNVWIGGGSIILPGVRIGRNAVIGAGSVVRRRVPADTIVAGNPARVLRRIQQQNLPGVQEAIQPAE